MKNLKIIGQIILAAGYLLLLITGTTLIICHSHSFFNVTDQLEVIRSGFMTVFLLIVMLFITIHNPYKK